MVSSRILKRRKRAQVGTLLAVLLILLPLPAGAYFYGQMTDLQDQSVVFTMDGTPDDPIFDQSLVEYDNVTDTYSYNRTVGLSGSPASYDTDVIMINQQYLNSSGYVFRLSVPYTENEGNIFTLFQQDTGDTDSTLTFSSDDSIMDCRPTWSYVTPVSPSDMNDNGVETVRIYFENNQALNLSYVLGVYDQDVSTVDENIGVKLVYPDGPNSDGEALGNHEIVHNGDVQVSSNGTYVDIEIPETEMLTASTNYEDGFFYLTIADVDGSTIDENTGVLVGLEMIGSEDTPLSMTGIWQAALVAIGLFGLVGAIIATPYMSIEGLTGDGMQGQRYKKGYNPRKYNNNRRK